MSKYQIFLDIVFLFFFGACAGWVLELVFRKFFSGSNPEHKWLNPGFLFGPCVPLYGIGTVVLFAMSLIENAVFGSFSGSVGYYFVMFFIMALVMTLIEYLVGLLGIHVMASACGTIPTAGETFRASSARCSRSSGACCRRSTISCCTRGCCIWWHGSRATRCFPSSSASASACL